MRKETTDFLFLIIYHLCSFETWDTLDVKFFLVFPLFKLSSQCGTLESLQWIYSFLTKPVCTMMRLDWREIKHEVRNERLLDSVAHWKVLCTKKMNHCRHFKIFCLIFCKCSYAAWQLNRQVKPWAYKFKPIHTTPKFTHTIHWKVHCCNYFSLSVEHFVNCQGQIMHVSHLLLLHECQN